MTSINESLIQHEYNKTTATTPEPREYRIGWLDKHNDCIDCAKKSKSKILIIGDSIASGLTRYKNVWFKYFGKNSTLNFGIPGDKTQHVLWRVSNIPFPETLQYVIVHSGSNNLEHDSADDIANATLLIGYKLLQNNNNFKIILYGILPRGEKGSMIRKKNNNNK